MPPPMVQDPRSYLYSAGCEWFLYVHVLLDNLCLNVTFKIVSYEFDKTESRLESELYS